MTVSWLLYFVLLGSAAFLCVYVLLYLPARTYRDYRMGLRAFARAVEIRELGTSGCADLRAYYAVQIAKRLRLPTSAIQQIESAALLQEIGKVSIPYGILNKQEPLTYDEQEVLKLHSVVGQHITQQLEWTKRLAPLIRHHHENWDGSGYPDGLRGEEIPLAAQILHIVGDFADALRGKDIDNAQIRWQAVQQIEAGKGTFYSPLVFDVFCAIVRAETSGQTNLPCYEQHL